ncbi:hypothetical protein [Rossellomorea aquimaris]|uniref:hypothetical protein n=1 Tax=Rossellomorea aquimaris TaxID=189382 RepID=UPI000A41A58D|nr:hypothetical protein [Rossellomorea aquimaris]
MRNIKVGIVLIVFSLALYIIKAFFTLQLGPNVSLIMTKKLIIPLSTFKVIVDAASTTVLISGIIFIIVGKRNTANK